MPTAFEFENGELVDCYDLGEAECPVCGYPVIGHFKSGVLVETEARDVREIEQNPERRVSSFEGMVRRSFWALSCFHCREWMGSHLEAH